jgi:hypothetical protein
VGCGVSLINRDRRFVAILRLDNGHLEGCSSTSTGVKSPHDLPQCRPPASPDAKFGSVWHFTECTVWIQSSNIHASERCPAIQSPTMDILTKRHFRQWHSFRPSSASRSRWYVSFSYVLWCPFIFGSRPERKLMVH